MVSCDYYFTVRDYLGREDTGEKDIYSDPFRIYGVMKAWDRSLEQKFSVGMMHVTFFIDVQDNGENSEQFEVNNVYEIRGENMTLAHIDKSNDGLLGVLFLSTGKTPPYDV